MTRQGQQLVTAAAVVAVTAAVVYAVTGGGLRLSAGAGADAGTGPSHWCPPEQLAISGGRLRLQHPLFRRPDYPGCHLDRISRGGWAWFLDPPSEEGL